MNKKEYQELVKKNMPKSSKFKNAFIAFFIGGIVGLIAQVISTIYAYTLNIPSNMATTFTIVTLIFLGCLLTSLGFFDKFVHFAKAGLIVPITGFAHSMMSATLEYKKDGFITGIGANMFKLAGSVIIYGVVSAYVLGLLSYLIIGG